MEIKNKVGLFLFLSFLWIKVISQEMEIRDEQFLYINTNHPLIEIDHEDTVFIFDDLEGLSRKRRSDSIRLGLIDMFDGVEMDQPLEISGDSSVPWTP